MGGTRDLRLDDNLTAEFPRSGREIAHLHRRSLFERSHGLHITDLWHQGIPLFGIYGGNVASNCSAFFALLV